jgi:hypothetical protein
VAERVSTLIILGTLNKEGGELKIQMNMLFPFVLIAT